MASDPQGTEAATGLPQLDPTTFANQIFWLLVSLVVIYFILSRIALPRIAAVLAERKGTITNDLAAAQDLRTKAAEAEKTYEKALADAKAQAQAIVAEARAEMKADLDAAMKVADEQVAEKLAEGDKKIADIRASALDSVAGIAKDAAREVVVAMGQTADGRSVSAAVTQRMKG